MFSSQDFSPIEVEQLIDELALIQQKPLWLTIATDLVQRCFIVRLAQIVDRTGILFISDFDERVFVSLTRCSIRSSTTGEGTEIVQRYELRLEKSLVLISTAASF